MKICIEESTYEGTPIEILAQLRAMTEQPCELPESSTGERAAALIRVLSEIGALELLEE